MRIRIGTPLSKSEIEASLKHPTRDQLARWGVPWPPPKGWRQRIIKYGIPYQDGVPLPHLPTAFDIEKWREDDDPDERRYPPAKLWKSGNNRDGD